MTVSEVAEYTGYSLGYIYQLTHGKKITFYKPGNGKLYFKRKDVDNFMFSNISKSHRDFEVEALEYNLKSKK